MLIITHNELAAVLDRSAAMRSPVCIWGAAGIGKSEGVRAWCAANGYDLIDFRLAQVEEADLRGLPDFEDGRTVYRSPFPKAGKFCLFLDELPQANHRVLNAASELILDRKCGDYVLPAEAIVIAGGNPPGAGYATSNLPIHIANRMDHVTLQFDADAVLNHWQTKYRPDNAVVQFLTLTKDAIQASEQRTGVLAFATARSWERVVRYCDAMANDVDVDALALYAQSAVGEGAQTMRQFLKTRASMPNIDAIMADPDSAPVSAKDIPSEIAQRVTNALMNRLRKADKGDGTAVKVARYFSRLPEDRARVAFALVDKEAGAFNDAAIELLETAEYRKWAAAYKL